MIMFLVIITQFVPISKAKPSIEDMFLILTLILFALTFVVLFLDWYSRHVKERQEKLEKEEKEKAEK